MVDIDQIQVNYNAADAIEQARKGGHEVPLPGEPIDVGGLVEILTGTPGRPVRLLGWHAVGTSILKIEPGSAEGSLRVAGMNEPLFEDEYEVGSDPAPEVNLHGDIVFALQRLAQHRGGEEVI